jgi:hypothetical protein
MNNITERVVRQALIEYIDARAHQLFNVDIDNPFDLSDERVRQALGAYILSRYGTHDEAFRARQMARLIPNLRAALTELWRMEGRLVRVEADPT